MGVSYLVPLLLRVACGGGPSATIEGQVSLGGALGMVRRFEAGWCASARRGPRRG